MAFDPDYKYASLTTEVRESVLKRDNYSCQDCGRSGKLGTGKGDLQIHHIIRQRFTNDHNMENLVTLCTSCHGKRETSYRVAPTRKGTLKRLPIRVETQEQYEQIVNVLSIDQRGALLIAASEKKS